MSNPFNLIELANNMIKVKQELPVLLANQAQRHFTNSFKEQGYEGKQWEEVKRRQEGTKEYKYPKYKGLSRRTKPILVRSGNLRRVVAGSIVSKTFELIKLIAPLPYASYQNEGTGTITARPFMKDSALLRAKQMELIRSKIDKAMKIN